MLVLPSSQASSCPPPLFYLDSLSDPSHGPACHSWRNNRKRTMKLYLHRNGVTRQRQHRRTPISFVFNQNEKFCWGRLFSACNLWRVCGSTCARVCLYASLPPLVLSRIPFAALVSVLRWLHFKLGDRLQYDKSCKWLGDDVPICCKLSCF